MTGNNIIQEEIRRLKMTGDEEQDSGMTMQ
jgi:hypothetical protein